jgi:hypothetical protein
VLSYDIPVVVFAVVLIVVPRYITYCMIPETLDPIARWRAVRDVEFERASWYQRGRVLTGPNAVTLAVAATENVNENYANEERPPRHRRRCKRAPAAVSADRCLTSRCCHCGGCNAPGNTIVCAHCGRVITERLPRFTFEREDGSGADTCAICLETISGDIIALACVHEFHARKIII